LAMIANLVSVYHFTPKQIGELTAWQIKNIYFHPRDKEGQAIPQIHHAKPGTMEYEIEQALLVAKQINIDPEKLVEKVKEKWKHTNTTTIAKTSP
jgi:hypothetical protein